MARSRTVPFLLASLLAAGTVAAQSDRETETPTDKQNFFNYTPAGIGALIGQGYRLSDLEVASSSAGLILFSGPAVRNTGEYATSWWWNYGVTPLELLSQANQHGAHLIDLEPYLDGGTPRYVAVMIDNFENFRLYGSSCATANGLLEHDAVVSSGSKGTTVYYRGRNLVPDSTGVLLLGTQSLAVPLGVLGMPGCSLYTDPLITAQYTAVNISQVVAPVAILDQAALVGGKIFAQFVSIDRTNVASPLATSNGIETAIRG